MIADGACLFCAFRSVVAGIEIEKNPTPPVSGERVLIAVLIGESEVGSGSSNMNFLIHGFHCRHFPSRIKEEVNPY